MENIKPKNVEEEIITLIRDYLCNLPDGKVYKDSIYNIENKIKNKKQHTDAPIEEHIEGMIMAMLTAERPWKYIDNSEMKDKINKAFKNYDAEALINADPEILEQDIRDIKAGNRRISQQTKALKHNIKNLQTYEEENESIDKLYMNIGSSYKVAKFIDKNFKEIGIPLACEYLANMGYDIPKPDSHLRRLFGSKRLGYSKKEKATIKEVFDIIDDFSAKLSTGENPMYRKSIDYLLWLYCAKGYGEVCGENADCEKCVIKDFCNKGKKKAE